MARLTTPSIMTNKTKTKKKVVRKKPAKKKKTVKSTKTTKRKSKAGRKWFDGKNTDAIIAKLEKAFSMGCAVNEALVYADICKDSYYRYLKKFPKFSERIELLKEKPILLARTEVVKGFSNNPEFSLKFLERKKKAEFAPHSSISAEIIENPMTPERKAEINERVSKWKSKVKENILNQEVEKQN